MTRTNYILQQTRVMNRIEKLFRKDIESALKNQISSFITTLKETGVEQARSRLALLPIDELVKALKMIYRRAALPLAKFHYRVIEKSILRVAAKNGQVVLETKAAFGLNEKWIAEIETFFRQYLLNKVVLPISETTKKQILEILNEGIEKGWSVDEIISKLQDPTMTKFRSRMIVRTEAVRATNYSSMLAASEFEYEMEKTWIEVKDNRTRRSHRHVSGVGGQTVDFMEKYSNGLMFPGDPNGSGKETINCRCTQGVKPKRNEQGRLIPITHRLPLNIALGMVA
jgi:hypothetical protein